jgi:uncharacterized protein (TIGR01777 family)
MNILIAGATGFIGKALCSFLLKQGYSVIVRTRSLSLLGPSVRGINHLRELDLDEAIDVAINLVGEPIADKRWSDKQKCLIRNSRHSITQEFVDYFKVANHKPEVFISGSAIGYYGIQSVAGKIDEQSDGDESFSSELCQQWESIALQSEAIGIRTCLLRTGIVLGQSGGALDKMLPMFKLGLGGRIGSGKQWMPWVHLSDMVKIIDFCIENKEISGAINCTAPNPVTNAEFTKVLAHNLKRPAFCHVPALIIRLIAGEMGKELLLSGKQVIPAKLQNLGFSFKYEQLDAALAEAIER